MTPHRIDPPGLAVARRTRAPVAGIERPRSATGVAVGDVDPPVGSELEFRIDSPQGTDSGSSVMPRDHRSPEAWLRLHASDLVDRLQSWASDLDAREAQLNARSSLQDHRERRFRLHQQDVSTELAEQQRAIERLRREVEAQARRLAFLSEPAAEQP